MPKKIPKPKHVPQRTCIGCREINPKRAMIRIVRSLDGVKIDPTGKMSGRGAYLHDKKSCWEIGMKGSLEQALKTTITEQDRINLHTFIQTLSDDDPVVKDSHAQ